MKDLKIPKTTEETYIYHDKCVLRIESGNTKLNTFLPASIDGHTKK